MKNLVRAFVGVIILPLIMVVVFSLVNLVLSYIFAGDYWALQNSAIWVLWLILTGVMMVVYFHSYPLK